VTKAIVLAVVFALALAAPAAAKREEHRVVVAPGAASVVKTSLGGKNDTVEIGIRHRGRWVRWKQFGSALVWRTRRFVAEGVSYARRDRIRVLVVNTSRHTVRARIVFDLLA
jgi:hypothetical protein